MKVVNLFGGPGSGKSTTAAGLFYLMKTLEYNVELVTEYAKDMVWEKRNNIFEDQLYITAKQNRKLSRLLSHEIEWVITDSPLLLGISYNSISDKEKRGNLNSVIRDYFNEYTNINFFLNRNKKYNPVGRNQNEQEARIIDEMLISLLDEVCESYTKIDGDFKAPFKILEYIKEYYE